MNEEQEEAVINIQFVTIYIYASVAAADDVMMAHNNNYDVEVVPSPYES